LKGGKKCKVGVKFLFVVIYLSCVEKCWYIECIVHIMCEHYIGKFWYISDYVIITIDLETWQPFVHVFWKQIPTLAIWKHAQQFSIENILNVSK